MPLRSSILLGAVQGVTEWLPVSSEGVITLLNTWMAGASVTDAIALALWLHLGTAVSATVVMRRDVLRVARNISAGPSRLAPETSFLIAATVVTAVVGLPVYLFLRHLPDTFGAAAIGVTGAGMLGTAIALWRWPRADATREKRMDAVSLRDALLAGGLQGVAVIPGVSRTALTVAALLGRGLGARDALALSVLMGIPASVGAAVLVALDPGVMIGLSTLVATATAAAVGVVTIRALLAFAARVRLEAFVAVAGVAILAGTAVTLIY